MEITKINFFGDREGCFCADIIIDDQFVIQRGTDGEYSLDDDDYCYIDEDASGIFQKLAVDKYGSTETLKALVKKLKLSSLLNKIQKNAHKEYDYIGDIEVNYYN